MVQTDYRQSQASYTQADMSFGISGGDWEVDFFINNLTDERAEIYVTDGFFDYFFGRGRVYTNRPREMGIRYKKSF